MNKRDIVIGILLLSVLAAIVFFVKRPKESALEAPSVSTQEKIEEKFKMEIPDDVDKAELKDVKGGNLSAIAIREYKNGRFYHTILADLPDIDEGYYEGWLVKGDDYVSTGKMRISKGGYVLDFESNKDYSDYNQVVVTLEKKEDLKPEEHLLEGSF